MSSRRPSRHAQSSRSIGRFRRNDGSYHRRLILETLEDRWLLSAFTPGDIVVYRIGTLFSSLGTSAAPVFIDEYAPDGTPVQSIPMPTAVSGNQRRLTASGTGTSEGLITRS